MPLISPPQLPSILPRGAGDPRHAGCRLWIPRTAECRVAGSAEAVEASAEEMFVVAPWVSVAFARVAPLDGVVGLFP